MTADVGCLVRALNNNNSNGGRTTGIVTRDFLGESFSSSSSELNHSQELDLDLQVPAGWEKCLDLKSGKVYLQNSSSERSNSSIQTTNFATNKRALTNLDLKLESENNVCSYESVCTLDKVKLALDRAKNNEQMRKMFMSRRRPSKSTSTSSASTKVTLEFDHEEVDEDEWSINSKSRTGGLLTAAGCPNCLMYVMISKENPKCPKCNLMVCLPVMKKARIDIDLNISI